MFIETWLAALIFVLVCGIAIVALANAMCLEDKLDEAHKENARLRDEICEDKQTILKLRHENIVALASKCYGEVDK